MRPTPATRNAVKMLDTMTYATSFSATWEKKIRSGDAVSRMASMKTFPGPYPNLKLTDANPSALVGKGLERAAEPLITRNNTDTPIAGAESLYLRTFTTSGLAVVVTGPFWLFPETSWRR